MPESKLFYFIFFDCNIFNTISKYLNREGIEKLSSVILAVK